MSYRIIDNAITQHFNQYKKILILLGSRQTGKTTLVKKLFPDAAYLLVDNEPVRKLLETYDINTYKNFIKPQHNQVIIDEIQLISDPGRAAKIIYDQIPDVQLIITGSSSFHIKNKTSESLAGRKIDYYLYPLTFSEYLFQNTIISEINFKHFLPGLLGLEKRNELLAADLPAILNIVLIYGLYPLLIQHPRDNLLLLNFVDSLIFKDLLDLQLIENRRLALNLLRLLAHQIGNLISYAELATQLRADQRTIKRYIEIFEQSYIVFRLLPYARNKRSEISRAPKIYFYDLGIRNALINNFQDLDLRPDKGALFENFIISETLKMNYYAQAGYNLYYWRSKQVGEIDLVLEKADQLFGLEIKYSQGRPTRAFQNNYPQAQVKVVTVSDFCSI